MIGTERPDPAIARRIAQRVEDILQAARDRERKGQTLALDIDARFRLQDFGAVQFQLASAILEEASGLRQEEVVTELLSLGLAAVLSGASPSSGGSSGTLGTDEDADAELTDPEWASAIAQTLLYRSGRVLN